MSYGKLPAIVLGTVLNSMLCIPVVPDTHLGTLELRNLGFENLYIVLTVNISAAQEPPDVL